MLCFLFWPGVPRAFGQAHEEGRTGTRPVRPLSGRRRPVTISLPVRRAWRLCAVLLRSRRYSVKTFFAIPIAAIP